MARRELGTLAHRHHDTRRRSLKLHAGLVDLRGEIPLITVVPLEQLGHDQRIGEELPFEVLLVDDLDEIIRIDSRHTLEPHQHPVVVRAGLDGICDLTMGRRVVGDRVVDLCL